MKKTIASVLIAGSLITTGTVTNLTKPINTNYIDDGSSLTTFVKANKVHIDKHAPKVTLEQWNGQELLGIKVSNVSTNSNPVGITSEVDNSIGSGQTVKMQPTSDGTGFNVDIQLAFKPTSNVFSYQFSGYQDMDFYYQPPLNIEMSSSTCTETDCGGMHRPENIVGSYAVYSKTHANHILGQTNYETGKLFNIYRPQVTDANGNKIWAILNYSNGNLTITVPQQFLDSAKYPILIDPTFGYTSTPGTQQNPYTIANQKAIYTYTASSGDTATQLNVWDGTDGASTSTQIGIYDFSGGHPVNRTGFCSASVPSGTEKELVSCSASISLVAGTVYTMATGANGGDFIWLDSGAAGDAAPQGSDCTRCAMPNPWTFGDIQAWIVGMYATYTPAAPAANPEEVKVNIMNKVNINGKVKIGQ